MPYQIALLVGSLRGGSLSGHLADALGDLAPPSIALNHVSIGDLPLYNEDLEVDPPAPWARFRDAIRSSDGILFVTPEYNRSIPGGLKNAIDIGSRPQGRNVFGNKPAAIISHSPGMLGGFGGNAAIRQSLLCLDVPVLPSPEAYFGASNTHFDADGKLTSDVGGFLSNFIEAFARWVDRHARVERWEAAA